jgi:hypothetical protein
LKNLKNYWITSAKDSITKTEEHCRDSHLDKTHENTRNADMHPYKSYNA